MIQVSTFVVVTLLASVALYKWVEVPWRTRLLRYRAVS